MFKQIYLLRVGSFAVSVATLIGTGLSGGSLFANASLAASWGCGDFSLWIG